MLDSAMYKFANNSIEIASLTPRKRLKIKLTDATKRDGNIRVVIDKLNQRVEIHSTIEVKVKENDNTNMVAIDKGFSRMLATSNNTFYGIKLSEKLIELSEKLNKRNKQRNKLRSLYKKYLEKGNLKKAKKIKRFNLGTKKYNRQKSKVKSNIESYINKSINEFIENEKPKTVVAEDLSFTTKSRSKKPKKLNRWLNSWLKGYIQDRLEYKFSANSAELAIVNPAYTSQICHLCNHFGERKGDRFYCETHGVVDADYNASVNILQRYYDNEISLFTPYKKVKQILISRLEVS
jgi:IS605 OrfB family transposase